MLSDKQRLIIDLRAVCDAYAVYDISNDGFVSSRNNPADGLTKIGKCGSFYPFFRLTNVILSQNKGVFVSRVQPQQPTICLLHPFAMLVHKSQLLHTISMCNLVILAHKTICKFINCTGGNKDKIYHSFY